MIGFESTLQLAVLTRLKQDAKLTALISDRIYDDAPENAVYPYIVLGEEVAKDISTDDFIRREVDLDIHVWSRFRGMEEVKKILFLVENALNRAEISVDDYQFVNVFVERVESMLDPDGMTRHGILILKVIIRESIK